MRVGCISSLGKIRVGKSIELVKSLRRRKISIVCVQETKWVGSKATEIDGYKLWYLGSTKAKNGVDILVEKDLADQVVKVRRKRYWIMAIKVLVGSVFVNVVSVYAPQVGLPEDTQKLFWEDLDAVTQEVPQSEKLFIG